MIIAFSLCRVRIIPLKFRLAPGFRGTVDLTPNGDLGLTLACSHDKDDRPGVQDDIRTHTGIPQKAGPAHCTYYIHKQQGKLDWDL